MKRSRALRIIIPALLCAWAIPPSPASADLIGFDAATTVLNQNNGDGSAGLASIGGGGTTLTLTDGGQKEARSAFSTAVQAIGAFQVQFVYHANGYDPNVGGADGVAFVLQNDPRGASAVGGTGFGLGYGDGDNGSAITQSFAFELNLLHAGNRYSAGTALAIDGTVGSYANTSPIAVDAGDPLRVTLTYDGTTLTESLLDLTNSENFTTSRKIDLATVLGGPTAFVGFTGGTGAMTSTQEIRDFQFTSGGLSVTAVPEPASWALLALGVPLALRTLRRRRTA